MENTVQQQRVLTPTSTLEGTVEYVITIPEKKIKLYKLTKPAEYKVEGQESKWLKPGDFIVVDNVGVRAPMTEEQLVKAGVPMEQITETDDEKALRDFLESPQQRDNAKYMAKQFGELTDFKWFNIKKLLEHVAEDEVTVRVRLKTLEAFDLCASKKSDKNVELFKITLTPGERAKMLSLEAKRVEEFANTLKSEVARLEQEQAKLDQVAAKS